MAQSTSFSQIQSNQAVALFWETNSRGWFYRLWARLTHHASRLLDLDEV